MCLHFNSSQLMFDYILGKTVKIINGEDANIKDFPFMVSFRMPKGNQHFCGGAIITHWHILTAAHCLYDRTDYYLVIKIHMGSTSAWRTTESYNEISNVTLHPDFQISSTKNGSRNDLAVVKVYKHCFLIIKLVINRIRFNEFQKKGILAKEENKPGDEVIMIGWGLVEYPSTFHIEQLQKVSTKIMTPDACVSRTKIQILSQYICTFTKIGVGGCIGDSGGPLIFKDKIIGIYSFSTPCARGYPDVFIKVKNYLNFIESATKM
ncbi:PREDICTED: chymotrypsin-2-like [Ceratosolen solmsi marchali]|uniref:Chymotrypsin-2-like n=1 Tax=Ceratosolen solmsi marchali TaxID=326594 RepID=A0AAJ6YC48_9HYME|nr:PREDICTED: chymotrypsin-2-like [Ceratosolen solmsi marchali]